MGVQQFLSSVLPCAGRRVDLRSYSAAGGGGGGGIVVPINSNNAVDDDVGGGRGGGSHGDSRSHRQRRKMRIGVDLSVWIASACVANGDMLGDERHLTNYGRAALLQEQQQQQQAQQQQAQQQQQHGDGGEDGGDNAGPTATSATTATIGGAGAVPVRPYLDDRVVRTYVTKCATYVTERLLALRKEAGADVLAVLDGANPPVKADNEGKVRSRKRKRDRSDRDDRRVDLDGDDEAQERRLKAYRRAGAGEHYKDVLADVLVSLREHAVPFLVSPYESDGQLAYLARMGYVDLVVTEDSDAVAYDNGVAPILFKMVKSIRDGVPAGVLLRRDDLAANRDGTSLDLTDYSTSMLAVLFCCIGCDYCEKLNGIGLVGAAKIVRSAFFGRQHGRNKTPLQVVLDGLFETAWHKDRMSEREKLEYRDRFLSAVLMYRHPVVYDPVRKRCIVVGTPDPELVAYPPYAELCNDPERRARVTGPVIESPLATFIAEGWISPKLKRPYDYDKLPQRVRQYLEQRHPADGGVDTATASAAEGRVEGGGVDESETDDDQEDVSDNDGETAFETQVV